MSIVAQLLYTQGRSVRKRKKADSLWLNKCIYHFEAIFLIESFVTKYLVNLSRNQKRHPRRNNLKVTPNTFNV